MSKNKSQNITRRQFLGYSGAGIFTTALVGQAFAKSGDPHVKPETGMRYRRLGRTNYMVSEIGLGCASGSLSHQLGPFLFEKWLHERGEVANKLLDLGGNFISTSTFYHNTIELITKGLKGREDEYYFAIGIIPSGKKKILNYFDKARGDMNRDVIDLVFSHGSGNEEGFEVLHKLKDEGKIKWVGMSSHDPREHEWAIRNNYIDWMHIPYNRLSRIKQGTADIPGVERILRLAREKDIGTIGIKPLTGNFIPYWAKQDSNTEVQEIMRRLKNYGPQNLYQAMLRWNLQNPNLNACAVGMDTVQQVVENVEAVKTRNLTAVQQELLEQYAGLADKDYCRMCETCTPHCPKEIPVPDILRFKMYYQNYGWGSHAQDLYNELPENKKAGNCDNCGSCEEHCPNGLAIAEKLYEAHNILNNNSPPAI